MPDFTLVDPELREGLKLRPQFTMSEEVLPGIRLMSRNIPVGELSAGVVCEELHIAGLGEAPPVRILVYRPRDASPAPRGGILEIHGGGYIIGFPEMGRQKHDELVRTLGCVIVSVDYRLAPETAFPGALEDCYAALKWFHENAGEFGVDPRRIGVSGTSAGGGLAAALALYVRDKGEPLLAFQHLIYPMIDDRTCLGAPNPHIGQHIWNQDQNSLGWRSLLGANPGGAGVSPYAAAARAQDLSRLPPTFLAVGALDLFLPENLDYASRLARAGVAVEAHVYPGAYHGFHFAQSANVTRVAERDSDAALARFFEQPVPG